MLLAENVSPQVLYALLECKRLADVPQILGAQNAAFQQRIALRQRSQKKPSALAHALFTTLTDATTSYPLYTLWMIIGCISLGFISLSIVTGGVLMLTLLMAGALFFRSYQKHLKNHNKVQHNEILTRLQLEAAEKIMALAPQAVNLEPDPPPLQPRRSVANTIKNFLNTAILTTTTLVGTYYLSAVAITLALGLATAATALTGPIGIGIACGVAALLGIYFGYKQYQSNKQHKNHKDSLKHLNQTLEKRTVLCEQLKNQLLPLNNTNHPVFILCRENRRASIKPSFKTSPAATVNNPLRYFQKRPESNHTPSPQIARKTMKKEWRDTDLQQQRLKNPFPPLRARAGEKPLPHRMLSRLIKR